MDKGNNIPTWFKDGSRIWFTSDTHFGHANIIRYTNRPFSDMDEMDAVLVANWNRFVGEDDLVFHLGDFGFSTPGDWRSIRERLNGHIVLILGNHDMRMYGRNPDIFRDLFEYVTPQMMIRIENRRVILNHCPLLCYSGAFKREWDATWQLFGHVHSGPLNDKGLDIPRLAHCFPYQYDVGVDNNGFAPVSWKTVCDRIGENLARHNSEVMRQAVDEYLRDEARQRQHYGLGTALWGKDTFTK